MRDANDPDERDQIRALLEAADYLSTPHVLAELARRYLDQASGQAYDVEYRTVCRMRARVLLQAARDLGPACCERHNAGGDLLEVCQ